MDGPFQDHTGWFVGSTPCKHCCKDEVLSLTLVVAGPFDTVVCIMSGVTVRHLQQVYHDDCDKGVLDVGVQGIAGVRRQVRGRHVGSKESEECGHFAWKLGVFEVEPGGQHVVGTSTGRCARLKPVRRPGGVSSVQAWWKQLLGGTNTGRQGSKIPVESWGDHPVKVGSQGF